MSISATQKSALDRNFTRTTNVWGNITLFTGFLIATYIPFHVLFFTDVDVSWGQIIAGFLAAAAAFGVFWVVEPITYFPILGPAGMYQAFMIGNISNKLLPAAIVAQSTIKATPGTRKAQFAATAAICGAAVIHVSFMLVFVGILGSWVVSIVPPEITKVAQNYILPSILGGVLVQLIVTTKNLRVTIAALVVGALVVFGLMPLLPAFFSGFTIAISVIITCFAAWFTRDKKVHEAGHMEDELSGPGIN
ncbi:hypothetical protein [Brevibacterium moorei]|uniref:hypothetical protein n=1 Tax=Brevibacterium moorei TaxID=2968457 RepID=UPI00211C04BE|nr:hypothetical protein [Brevibacterium sp. 68QC2CO]MCQ9386892.1 hypothetical protein [Brevibacterium sp. 68QC2CO]